ncbi:hypothetical protein D3C81_2293700 [compost metagenome]
MAEMDANLMRPPGLQLHMHQASAMQCLALDDSRHGRLSAGRDASARSVMPIAPNRGIDHLKYRRHCAFDDRGVVP